MLAPGFTKSVKLPSKSVVVPFWVPLSMMLTPVAGPMASLTVPVTFTVCAIAATPRSRSTIEAKNLLFILLDKLMVTITFCGDGPNKENILNMASEAGISDRVRIVTGISEEEVIDLYNEAMLVFNTSLLEGTGLVTLEAQRCGTPVLHLNRAQIPEPVTRLSVGCDDPSDMAEKAYALISDPDAYDDAEGTHVFVGWDTSYSDIQADTDIHAVYVLSSTQTVETTRYTVYLHAVYGKSNTSTRTHITWYANNALCF